MLLQAGDVKNKAGVSFFVLENQAAIILPHYTQCTPSSNCVAMGQFYTCVYIIDRIWKAVYLKTNSCDPVGTYYLAWNYTQSQKKRTINSLASPAIQDQGQMAPAGSFFI